MSKNKIIAVSGGFDPVHWGHVKMIREAAAHGDVLVIANSDEWLMRKKRICIYAMERASLYFREHQGSHLGVKCR